MTDTDGDISGQGRADDMSRQSETGYRTFFTSAKDGIFLMRGEFFMDCNPAALRMFGCSREQLLGHTPMEFSPPVQPDGLDTFKSARAKIEAALAGESLSFQWRHRRLDGSEFDTEVSLTRFERDVSQPLLLAIVRDITERKRAEEALRASEVKYRALFESARDAILIMHGEHVVDCNPAALRMFGCRREQLLGQSPDMFAPAVQPDGRDSIESASSRITAALAGESQVFQWRERRLDGTEFDAEVSLTRLEQDVQPRVLAIVRDITERKRVEEASRASELKYRELVENANSFILRWNRQGQVTFLNEFGQAFFGYPENEILGKHVVGTIVPPSASTGEDLRTLIERIAADPAKFEHNVNENMRRDGSRVWVAWTNRAVFDEHGQLMEVFSVGTDITELRRAEEALRQEIDERKLMEEALRDADRRKNEFLAMLSHELRNPLAPVRNSVQLLRLQRSQDTAVVRQYDIIDRQVTHMARLLDDLLDVSRITSGRVALHLRDVRLSEVVSHAVEIAEPSMKSRGHSLTINLPPEDIIVKGDPDRLAQTVGNLLNNAAKYTSEEGTIVLSMAREGDQAVIRLRDNGIGIDPGMLPRIFGLFVQADQSLARPQGGLGIGLTLAKSIIEMHGGHIEAHSSGLGEGSEFVVRLPFIAAVPQPQRVTQATPTNTLAQPRRVLVVDDVVDYATSLSMLLEQWGHQVRVAHDGQEAISIASQFQPDVVLLDVGLPGMDGYEVAKRLREDFKDRHVMVIAQTGYGQDSDRERAEQAGFDHHMVKPLDLGVLRQLVEQGSERMKDEG